MTTSTELAVCRILNCLFYITIAIVALLLLHNSVYYRFEHHDIPDSSGSDYGEILAKSSVTPEPSNMNTTDATEKLIAIAKKSCAVRKLGEYCIKDLLAIAYAESRFHCQKIGDKGMAFGCYQIHLGYHTNITKEQARDLNFAINWTLSRMVSKGYPKYRSVSLMAHNGTPNTAKTLSYLSLINSYREKDKAAYQ